MLTHPAAVPLLHPVLCVVIVCWLQILEYGTGNVEALASM